MKINLFKCAVVVLSILVMGGAAIAQNVTVSGRVYDSKTDEPIPGAAVMIQGTSIGAITDSDGKYTLKGPGDGVLICQFYGYTTQEVNVANRSVVNFALEEDTEVLEQSVVVGYGTLKKTQLVGSVENLSGETIEGRPNADITRSLQGQVAGLNIIQVDGKASHSGNLYIRGNATSYYTRANFSSSAAGSSHSLGAGGSALILIDGVEGSLSQVNPADVETVAVLKDASSSAIYGARAAYGVVLVTTKNADQDKFTVTYNGSFTLSSRIIKWEDELVTDGYEWTKAFYEFYSGTAVVPGSSGKTPTTINTLNIALNGNYTYLETFEMLNRLGSGNYSVYGGTGSAGQYIYFGSTNWISEFYKRNTTSQTHDISVRGSSKKLSYSLTGRYFSQGSIYKIGNEFYNTFNLRSKVKLQVTDWLSIDNNTSLFRSKQSQPMFTTSSMLGKQLEQHGQPIAVPYNEDGTYTLNAAKTAYMSFLEGNTGQDDSNVTVITTLGATIDLKKDVLKVRGDFSYKAIRRERERYRAPLSFYAVPGVVTEYVSQASSYKSRWTYDTDYMTANAYLTWTPKFGDRHDLNVVAGWNLEDYNYNRFYIQRKGMLYADKYASYELFDGTDYTIEQNGSSYGNVGFFARANYSLLKRYIIEVSGRVDGSSLFPSNGRWGFFPALSLGWRLSEEPFMDWSDGWLDNFKIRANYGSLGNGQISAYYFLETMGIDKTSVVFDGTKVNYTTQPSVIPDDLTWETVTTYDVGIDADFLGNRLSFSGDIYRKITSDLIVTGTELPGIYGTSPAKTNAATLKTHGWELTLSWRDSFKLAGKDFKYGIKGSLWDTRTWVKSYTSSTGDVLGYYSGKELGEIWGFRTDGIFRSNEEANAWATDSYHKNGDNFRAYAGDLKFVDLNGDGKIDYGDATIYDHGDLDVIGNTTPRYQYGINLDFSWSNIGLSLFFQGVGKRDWYPQVETGFFWGMYNRPYGYYMKTQTGDNYAQVDYGAENWVVTNYEKNPYWTRRVGYAANRNVGPLTVENDHYLQNVAYIRLKNLTVDYTLPRKWVQKVSMQGVKFYVTMENLFTWSPLFRHTTMFDPEAIATGDTDFDSSSNYGLDGVGDGYSYPMLRSFTFGVNLTF